MLLREFPHRTVGGNLLRRNERSSIQWWKYNRKCALEKESRKIHGKQTAECIQETEETNSQAHDAQTEKRKHNAAKQHEPKEPNHMHRA